MNRLYKTYIFLRRYAKRLYRDVFGARLDSHSDFNSSLASYGTDHVMCAISSNSDFKTAIENREVLYFKSFIDIDDVLDVDSNIKSNDALSTSALIGSDMIPNFTTYIVINSDCVILRGFIPIGDVIDATSNIYELDANEFGCHTGFTLDDEITPESEIHMYPPESVNGHIGIDGIYVTSGLLSTSPLIFNGSILVDDAVYNTIQIDNFTPKIFIYDIDSDFELIADGHIDNHSANLFNSEVIIQDVVDCDLSPTNYVATIFKYHIDKINIPLRFSACAYVENASVLIRCDTLDVFVDTTFSATAVQQYIANEFNAVCINIIVKDELDAHTVPYDCTDAKLVNTDAYVNVDFDATSLNAYLSSYFNYIYDIYFDVKMYTGMEVSESVVEYFAASMPISLELDETESKVTLSDVEVYRTKVDVNQSIATTSKFILPNVLHTYVNMIFNDDIHGPKALFTLPSLLDFKTFVSNTFINKFESHFCYSTLAKLNEYNDVSYTLYSMSSSTLNELSYHQYSY